jgi:hypothetical protein
MTIVDTGLLRRFLVRGMFGGRCVPSVFIDGAYMFDLPASDLDAFVKPDEVAGIEVYTGLGVPGQFSAGNFGLGPGARPKEPCGAVVVWTRARARRPGMTWATAGRAVGVVALSLVAGRFLISRR